MGFLGLFSRHKPKIKQKIEKSDGFSGWLKCLHCHEMIHYEQLADNMRCCPKCDYHYPLPLKERIDSLADEDSFKEMFTQFQSKDPLSFIDTEKYSSRLKRAQNKTERDEGVVVGICKLHNREIALGILDFQFMGGSMGSVVGERLTSLIECAIASFIPLVIVSASGGARMQESILSLMQMAKTSAAIGKLHEAGLPYISILTNPTTGGVTASFASLGDIILAEPDALVGFAGPRVIEQTLGQKLPDTAQKSEFLLEKGMIDCIVSRKDLKQKISVFLEFLSNSETITKNAMKMRKQYDQSFQKTISSVKQKIYEHFLTGDKESITRYEN